MIKINLFKYRTGFVKENQSRSNRFLTKSLKADFRKVLLLAKVIKGLVVPWCLEPVGTKTIR